MKDSVSILTILAFIQMLGQFCLARLIKLPFLRPVQGKVFAAHILLGYLGATVLLLHPLLVIAPRYFEAGISPGQAFTTIITTATPGILTGIASWVLLLLIFLSSVLRAHIPIRYRDWRRIHGVMSIAFISLASWHAIYLGRHMNQTLSAYVIILASVGVLLVIQRYISELIQEREKQRWILPEKTTPCPGEIS